MTRRHACMHLPFTSLLVMALVVVLGVGAPARGADDPVGAAMKLYEKRRYEQAARMLEDALTRLEAERRPQAQLVLGMIYVRNADLHETGRANVSTPDTHVHRVAAHAREKEHV